MQTFGLSGATPRSESRFRALFWPTIRNTSDLDYVSQQGFWICFIVAAFSVVLSVFSGSLLAEVFEGLFFFLAALASVRGAGSLELPPSPPTC